MKVDRHGKAKILSQTEIQLLFSQGFQTDRDRALFGICTFPDWSRTRLMNKPIPFNKYFFIEEFLQKSL